MKKIIKIIALALLFGIFAVISLFTFINLPWIGIYIGMHTTPNPSQPEIKYGEFPFTLEYEIDNQYYSVSDTLICEYNGYTINEADFVKRRDWKVRLASGNKEILLLEVNDDENVGKIIFKIPNSLGAYYMGETDDRVESEPSLQNIVFLHFINDKLGYSERFISKEMLLQKYKLKMINFTCKEPLKNQFYIQQKL